MNGKRCAILLREQKHQDEMDAYVYSRRHGRITFVSFARIFGSHSEAKRELKKWLPAWPDANIVEERDL